MNESNWSDTADIPWVEIFTLIVEFKLRKVYFSNIGKEPMIFPVDVNARIKSHPEVIKAVEEILKIPMSISIEADFEEETTFEIDEKINHAEIQKILSPKVIEEIVEELEIEEPESVGTMFGTIEAQFESELSKSKKTLIDAKVLISRLRKDFRFGCKMGFMTYHGNYFCV
jgi:hypothetical protein